MFGDAKDMDTRGSAEKHQGRALQYGFSLRSSAKAVGVPHRLGTRARVSMYSATNAPRGL